MFNNHLELIPLILNGSVLLIYFIAVAMLYRRWSTKNYLILTGSIGFVFLFFFLITILRFFQGSEIGDLHIMPKALLLCSVGSIITFAGTFHFLSPKNKKEFVQLVVLSGSVLILSLALIFLKNLFLTAAILFVEVVGYYIFFIIRFLPLIKKKNYFFAAIIFHILAVVLLTIHTLWTNPAVIVVSLFFQSGFFLALLLAFFDRILDLVNIALQHSVTDGLTGLYYKTYFINKVSESLSTNSAIIFSDIDNFKNLNDTQGHHVGDQILKLVGNIMKEIFETKGIAGRYGGEEMVALVTKPQSDCRLLAEKFRSRVEQESKAIYPVTVSVGYRLYDENIGDAVTFIRQADQAMYEAKRGGKNRVVEYSQLLRQNEGTMITHKEVAISKIGQPPEVQSEPVGMEIEGGIIRKDEGTQALETTQDSESAVEIDDINIGSAEENRDEVSADQTIEAVEDPLLVGNVESKIRSAEENQEEVNVDQTTINNPLSAADVTESIVRSEVEPKDEVNSDVVQSVSDLITQDSPIAISARQASFNPFKKSENSFSNVNLQKSKSKKADTKPSIKSADEAQLSDSEIKTLTPEETEAEIERLLEENYRNHYGDRDPNGGDLKTLKDSSTNEISGTSIDAKGVSFSNPFKKATNTDPE